MVDLRVSVRSAVAAGHIEPRIWIYSNYHCNRTCGYCLVGSSPTCEPREFGADRILRTARRARELGFDELGITGGEPFLLTYLPDVLEEASRALPLLVLSNGTVFDRRRRARLASLAELPVRIQISLDHPDPVVNDAMRGPDGFRRAVSSISALVDMGITVRLATTVPEEDLLDGTTREMQRLCRLHRELGVSDDEHVIRPIIRRGRAQAGDMGRRVSTDDLAPELTLTRDGAFWSPFAPTVNGTVIDTDMLLTRTVEPLDRPLSRMLELVEGRPSGQDARTGVR